MKTRLLVFLSLLGVLAFAGAANQSNAHSHKNIYKHALTAEGRLEADLDADTRRKPDEVLAFFGLKPGMTVIDIWAAGGYYTDIASHVVGPKGRVIMHNHNAYKSISQEQHDQRFKGGRLSNVTDFVMDNDVLDFGDTQADMVLIILGFHDIYYVDADGKWPTVDEAPFLDAVVAAMKPGAVLGVVDHRAPAGSGPETGNTTHRIAQQVVVDRLAEHGLVLEASSDILANAEDDLAKNMYDPAIRGHTDRMVLKFRKPK